MHSLEMIVIIPIIIILILSSFMMFYFATELGRFELDHSRVFMMSVSEPSRINGIYPKMNNLTITNTLSIRTLLLYNAHETLENPFINLLSKSEFNLNSRFHLSKIERVWLVVVKSGLEDVLK